MAGDLFSDRIFQFLNGIREKLPAMPKGVELLLPYESEEVRGILETFYSRYYADHLSRKLILGINPGRHGA
ncbi:MAG TPA: hypothetical protein VFX48_00730, partial [Saprospiraceae bacterium]|nr:hypothetical protein [Saprospiraceae bacterium]